MENSHLENFKNILIIGVNGFLGDTFVDYFKENSYLTKIHGVSRGHQKNKNLTSYCQLDLVGDVENISNILSKYIQECKPDVIYNFASNLESKNSLEIIQENEVIANSIYRSVLKYKNLNNEKLKLPLKFFHMGSAAEYGVTEVPVDINEKYLGISLSNYGKSKLIQTKIFERFKNINSVDTCILRIFNVLGRGMDKNLFLPTFANRVYDIVNSKKTDSTSLLVRCAYSMRDFIHLKDVLYLIYNISHSKFLHKFNIFNIGTGQGIRIIELAQLFLNLLEVRNIEVFSDKNDVVNFSVADITKIKSMNLEPKFNCFDAVKDYIGTCFE